MPSKHAYSGRDRERRKRVPPRSRRVLRRGWRLLAVLATATAIGVSPATATPTNTTANASTAGVPAPDHGVPPATFRKLWSGDVDGQATDGRNRTSLLTLVDYPFRRPPAAVGQWTRGDHREFPTSGPARSVIPPAADTSDRRWLR